MEDNNKNVEFEERNATLDEDMENQLSESELQDKILEDSDMSGFQKFIARMDDAKWKLVQRIFGVFLGLGTSIALFWEQIPGVKQNMAEGSKAGSYSLIIAVVVALLIPNIIEKRGGRKITQARFAMVITLGIAIVAFFIMSGVRNGWHFMQK